MNEDCQDHLGYIRELEVRLGAAEEALHRLQHGSADGVAPYRNLVNEMAEGALVLAPDDLIVFCNQQFAAILDIPIDRVTGSRIDDFTAPDDARSLPALLAQGRRTGAKAEIRLRRPGGKLVRALLTIKGVPTDGAEGACVIVKDLTDRTESQELRAAEIIARCILEEAAAPILLVDPDGRIIRANRAAERLADQSPLSRDFDDVFHVRLASSATDWSYAGILAAARSGRIEGLELAAAQSGGRTFDLLLSAVPLFDDGSQLLGCILTLIDVTGRRQAEEALRRSRERLEMAHHAACAGTWDRDFTTGRLDWSAGLFRLLGLDPNSASPSMELFFSVMHDDDRELARLGIAQAVREHTGLAVEYRVVLPDGRIRWISALGRGMYDAEGQPLGTTGICIDITANKLAEQEIHKSRAQLKAAFHAMQDGVVMFDMEGDVILANEAMGRITGFTGAREMKRRLDFFPGCDVRQLDGTPLPFEEWPASRVMRGESFAHCPLRARLRDTGLESFFSVSGAPVFDRSGRQILAVTVVRDITGQMLLEEEVRRRAEEVAKVMEVAPVAIWVAHDPQCRTITGNRAANRLFETAGEGNMAAVSAPGVPVSAFRFSRNGRELSAAEFPMQAAIAQGEDVRDAEVEFLASGGKLLTLCCHASPLRDAAGQVRGCVGAFLDMTQTRQRAEAALRESEERFQTMADTAPMMIWIAGADGACQFVNQAWQTFTGSTREGALGLAWTDCIHPDDLEKYLRNRSSALQSRRSFQVEYRLRRADGEYRWVLARNTPRFGVDGVFAGLVGSCLDITDVKHAQEEDLARQKLESVGTLAGGIAHDFNNLLGGVLASTELALAEVAGGSSPVESLHRIRDVAVRGAEIVRQLMIYAGEESPDSDLVDVSRVVDDMVQLLKMLTSKHVTVKTALGTGLPAVAANPAQIRQVIMNLVINASEAIGEAAGVIEVVTSKTVIGSTSLSMSSEQLPGGDYVRLAVSDTGCGMTPATQARVFDPFFTTKTAGHGLGLAVVQGIVRVLGGAIGLVSTPRGTTFEILLPCADEAAWENARADGGAAAAGEGGREKASGVLVIEDEDALRAAVSNLLRKSGYFVVEAGDGSTGLDLLRRHQHEVSAILLDVTLPGMSSQEIFRQARQLRPDLKVILTSAYSEERVTSLFAGAKFDGFIRKPYRLADLKAAFG